MACVSRQDASTSPIMPVVATMRILSSGFLSDQLPMHQLRKIDGAHDPHLWFDVALWTTSLQGVLKQIKRHYPALIEHSNSRISNYVQKLHALDRHVDSTISIIPKKRRILITAHDAFGYFGRAYDIQVIGLQGMSTLS